MAACACIDTILDHDHAPTFVLQEPGLGVRVSALALAVSVGVNALAPLDAYAGGRACHSCAVSGQSR